MQRSACRDRWRSERPDGVKPSSDDIAGALLELVARHLRADPGEISPDHDLTDLGLDSIQAVELAEALGLRFGIEVDHGVFYDNHTVAAVSLAIADGL